MIVLFLWVALSPLLESARGLAESGKCQAALPLYLQVAYTPDAPEAPEALLGAARCALAAGDTTLGRVLMDRFLKHPDPFLPLMQQAWELARILHPPEEALVRFAPFLFVLPTDTLEALLPKAPDSLRFGVFQELRARGERPPLPDDLPCIWLLHEKPDHPDAWLCREDTLRAVLQNGVSPEKVRSWLVQDSLRCLPGSQGVYACESDLEHLFFTTPDSLRDTLLAYRARWGRDWPEVRKRLQWERQWEQTGVSIPGFYPLKPAPDWPKRLFDRGLFLSPETLLIRARDAWVLEGWPPPRTGQPALDRLLFQLHFLRYRRDQFWERPTGALLDSLAAWIFQVDSLPYAPVLEVALAAELPRLPYTRIPIPELSRREILLLARYLGHQGLVKPFRSMVTHLQDTLARQAAFAFFVEARMPDSAFRYLDVRDREALLAFLKIAPPSTFQEAAGLYIPQARREELPLLARMLHEFSELPDPWIGFLARPLPESLRIPLVQYFLRKSLIRGDLHQAGVLSLHAPDLPEARAVRFLLGVEPERPALDSTLLASLPESLQIHWQVDTLTPVPSLDSLPDTLLLPDRLRLLLAFQKQDTLPLELLPRALKGRLPRQMRAVGQWLHARARRLYQRGRSRTAWAIWRFLLDSEDRHLQALSLYHLGILEKNARRLSRAVTYLDRLFRAYADVPKVWKEGAFLLAGILSQEGQHRKALQVLTTLKGLVGAEEEGERRYFEMQAWKALGDYDRAVLTGQTLWKRYASRAPGWAITAALDVAQFWVIRGHADRARTLLQEVVERFPRHPLTETARNQLKALAELEKFQGR